MLSRGLLLRRGWLALPLALAISVFPAAAGIGAAPGIHTVDRGETLSEIAEGYGISLATLAAANGIADPDLIIAGTTVLLAERAGNTAASALPARGTTHRVGAGETLEGIAAAYGTSVAALLAANPQLTDPNLLIAGRVLQLPTAAAPSAAIAALLAAHAREYGLDPTLVQAIAWQESGWQQGVSSAAGAIGVMQILPETGAWVASAVVGAPLDIADSTADNITAGTALLAWLIAQAGDEDLALAYYVQGQGSVASAGVLPETRQYIANVRVIQAYIARYGAPPN